MADKISNLIADRIRYYRRNQGLTQRQLADGINCAEKSISHFESGRRVVSMDVLARISVFLKVPMEKFFEGVGYSYSYNEDISEAIQHLDQDKQETLIQLIHFLK